MRTGALLPLVVVAACGTQAPPVAVPPIPPTAGTSILERREMAPLYELVLKLGAVPAPEGSFYQVEARPDGTLHCWSAETVSVLVDAPCAGPIQVDGELVFHRQSERAVVTWNGETILERFPARRPASLAIDVPSDRVIEGKNRFEVRFLGAVAPHDVDPASEERRVLGGDFTQLRIDFGGRDQSDRSVVTPARPFVARLQLPPAPRIHLEGSATRAPGALVVSAQSAASFDSLERRLEVRETSLRADVSLAEIGAGPTVLTIRWDGAGACADEPELRLADLRVLGEPLLLPARAAREGDVSLFLLGLDGATFDVLDREMAAGRLPNFRALVERGVRAPLRTLPLDHSPVIWATISTGQPPERHGIADFTYVDPRAGKRRIFTSRDRREPTVWEILGASGREVAIVGWWNSWPAEPVTGRVVSDLLWPYPMGRPPSGLAEKPWGTTFPEDLASALEPLVQDAAASQADVASLGCRPEDWHFVAEDRTGVLWALRLLDESQPAFFSLYLKNLDAFQHRYWKYMAPDAAEYAADRPSADDVASFGTVIPRYYQLLDETLGRLLSRLRPGTDVIVLSDHGFGPAVNAHDTDGRELSGGHRPLGIFIAAGPSFASGKTIDERSVFDVAPTILALYGLPGAADMPGSAIDPAFAGAALARPRPARVASYSALRRRPEAARGDTPHEREILDRLRQLGYIGADGPQGVATP